MRPRKGLNIGKPRTVRVQDDEYEAIIDKFGSFTAFVDKAILVLLNEYALCENRWICSCCNNPTKSKGKFIRYDLEDDSKYGVCDICAGRISRSGAKTITEYRKKQKP